MVSQRWAYVRIVTGTILGGVLGFYVMHRVEISYKATPLSLSFPPHSVPAHFCPFLGAGEEE